MSRSVVWSVFTVALMVGVVAAAPAQAALLEPLKKLLAEAFTDLKGMFSIIGGIAFLVGLAMMAFGRGNAWAVAAIGFVLILALNIDSIISVIDGL